MPTRLDLVLINPCSRPQVYQSLGTTLTVAHQRMESVEHAARILLTARLLGRVNELTVDDVRALHGHARNND